MKLKSLLKKELSNYPELSNFNLVELMYRQAQKESSLNPKAERYESHINDSSVGLFQLLTSTMRQLGFKGTVEEMFDVNIQVKYAVKYIAFLYSKFPEIHNEVERLKISFASYNCGRGNINEGIKELLLDEGIEYAGKHTPQGKWVKYKSINKAMVNHKIISKQNADINRRYINYIFKGVKVKRGWLGNTLGMINHVFK